MLMRRADCEQNCDDDKKDDRTFKTCHLKTFINLNYKFCVINYFNLLIESITVPNWIV